MVGVEFCGDGGGDQLNLAPRVDDGLLASLHGLQPGDDEDGQQKKPDAHGHGALRPAVAVHRALEEAHVHHSRNMSQCIRPHGCIGCVCTRHLAPSKLQSIQGKCAASPSNQSQLNPIRDFCPEVNDTLRKLKFL